MTDQIEQIENADSEKVETPAKETMFTQAQLDKIVKDRLAREKALFVSQKEAMDNEKASLNTSLEAYESKLKDLITPSLESVPEEYKELVGKLPLLEQVEFINKLPKVEKKAIPSTPKEKSGGVKNIDVLNMKF